MRFNLKLDESLFDDVVAVTTDLDDDFSEYDSEHDPDTVLPGPAQGSDNGVANELISLIHDEWEAIQGYNDAIATLKTLSNDNPFYISAIKVLEEITAEENVHVGQLQEVLKQISPNAAEIQAGTREARSQLGLVGGVLPVQSWDSVKSTPSTNDLDVVTEMCTISDVDDEM